MDLPDAPADRAQRARQLPDLRHGARTDDPLCRRGSQSRARRHDPAVLGRGGAVVAARWHWSWASTSLPSLAARARARSVWLQLVLATPVVLWGGWPFFQRGWASLVNRRLNMFTLIALGTGVAYGYSLVAALAAGHLSGIVPRCRTEPCRSTSRRPRSSSTLVLLGQVLELRARGADRRRHPRAARISRRRRARLVRDDGSEEDVAARRGRSGRPSARAARREGAGRRRRARRARAPSTSR